MRPLARARAARHVPPPPVGLHRRAPPGARIAFCHNACARHALRRADDDDVALADFGAAGANFVALDLAHALNDDLDATPSLATRKAFLAAYLAAVHGRPATGHDVAALLGDVAFFTIVDNYRRGLAAVVNAARCDDDQRAAGLLLEAQTRLRDARVQQYVLVW